MSTNRSGGPRTPEGKAVSSRNAVKFGLYSESPVLPEVEVEDEWLEHRRCVFADAAPVGYLEEALTERIALSLWRLKRLVRYEKGQVRIRQSSIGRELAVRAMAERGELAPESEPHDLDRIDRWLMDRLIPEEQYLSLMMKCEGHLQRHLLQLLHELEAMKARRRGESAPLARLDIQGLDRLSDAG